jgi:hypothetical protein
MEKKTKKVVGFSIVGFFLAIFGIFFFRVRRRLKDEGKNKSILVSQNRNGVYDSNKSESRILNASKEEFGSWLNELKKIREKIFN